MLNWINLIIYNAKIQFQIFIQFQRFGHTMIPPGIYQRDGKCNFEYQGSSGTALRLCSSWWDAQVNDV